MTMNYRTTLSIILLAVASVALAKDNRPDCHGCEYPFRPDPPCTKICVSQALNLATREELSKKFHLDDKTVEAIENARRNKLIESLDDLKKSLSPNQITNLKQTLNSKDVSPIINRQKTVLEKSDKDALKTQYHLDNETANTIVEARKEQKGTVTLQDLNTKLTDQQKLELMDAMRKAKPSSGPQP